MLSFRFILLGLLLIFNFPSFAAPEKISLQLKWLNSFQFAGYYAAKAKGFYAAENLDVELHERKIGINNIQQVINGESEYGVADTALLVERLNGVPVVVLASIFQHSPLVYITLKSSGIESPYEMRGKRIMDDTHDNAPLRTLLYEAGLKDEFIHLPNSGKIDDLIQGKTDVFVAYSTDEPEFYAKRGIEINIIDPRNYGVDFLGDNLFTTQQEINKHPERVQKFLRASLKGWQYAVNHPDEIIDLILSQYNTRQLSREHLNFEARETLKIISSQSVSIGHSDIKRFERIAQIYKDLGQVKSTENLNGFIYNQQQTTSTISLTKNEKEWLAMHSVIRVGIDPDFAPYESLDKKDSYTGLSADYLFQVENQLGVKFEIVKTKSFAETITKAENGEVDMITDVNQTPNRERYLNFTEAYISNPVIIVDNGKNGFMRGLAQLSGKRVSIERGYFIAELIAKDYPEIEVVHAENIEQALKLVTSGEVDAYIGDAASVNFEISKLGMLNLRFAGETEYRSNHRFGVQKKHPELLSILTKALNAIPENEKIAIQNRWLSLKAQKEINFEELAKYVAPLILFIFYGIYRNVQLRREISQRKKLEAALKNSIYLFKSVINNAPVIRVFWKDVDGNYLGANNNFAKDAGLNYAEELIGKNDFDMAWKEEGELYRADDKFVMQTNMPKLNYEEPQTTPDGKEIILRTSKVPLHDENGKVIGIIGIYEDITQSKMYEQQLEHIAYHDVLTGLPNRSLLADRMQLALAHARRNNSFVAICYLDLDGFKTVNDSLGHKAGDVLLVEAANRMKKTLRQEDTVARLGGDEFVLILREFITLNECEIILLRLLEAINKPFYIENHIVSVSASIGVTIYPNDNADADTLLRHADQAMYEAKQTQKNCFKIYNTEIAHEFEAQQNALKEIEKAILENEFVLFFQPKVDMQKGKIIGAEALIRWNHPERGLLMPNDFLALIDNHPLAIQLDAWVMNNALKQMTKWHECGLMWTISVNLSAGSLQTHNFSEQLAALLADYPNVKPEHFELEILETEALQDLAQTSEMIIACQALGVKFSLDDFGTGYSSLAYLKHLPANILKIDQSFVRDMLDDPDDLAIVKGVIGLAASFKRYVIAEGVETIEHGVMIAHLKCDYAQGYAIAKPMPAITFEIWAETWKLPKEWIKPR